MDRSSFSILIPIPQLFPLHTHTHARVPHSSHRVVQGKYPRIFCAARAAHTHTPTSTPAMDGEIQDRGFLVFWSAELLAYH